MSILYSVGYLVEAQTSDICKVFKFIKIMSSLH